jgi:hypothetical protein
MARSAGSFASIAVLAVVGHVIFCHLHDAFVASSPSYNGLSRQLRSRVILGASKAEVAEAEKQAKLFMWAAKTTAGTPQGAAMQAKADQAEAAWQALKAGEAAPPPAAVSIPVASAPVVSAPVAMTGGVSKAEIAEAEKQAKLLMWAAKTTAGTPQAAMMQAKADQAVAAWEALKAGEAAPRPAAVSIPVASAPVASAPVAMTGTVSKAEIADAEKKAKLLMWAAKTTAQQGSPQAATMQAKANEAVAAWEALKAGETAAPPAAVSAPVAVAPVTPVAVAPVVGAISKAALAEAEKQAKLLMWAAKTTAASGAAQAAQMKAKADAAVAAWEAMKAAPVMA